MAMLQFENINTDKLLFHLSALDDVMREISSHTDLNTSMSSLLRLCLGCLGSSKGCVFLFNPNERALVNVATRNIDYPQNILLSQKNIDQMLEQKEPLSSNQLSRNYIDLWANNLSKLDVAYWMPLSFKGELVGAIASGPRPDKKPFGQTEIVLFSMIARQVSTSLANFNLVEHIKEANAQLQDKNLELKEINSAIEELRRIGIELTEVLEVEPLLNAFVQHAVKHAGAKSGAIFAFVEEGSPHLEILASYSLNGVKPGQLITIGKADALSRAVLVQRSFVTSVRGDYPWLDAHQGLIIPLKVRDRFLGILALFDKEKRGPHTLFTERDELLLTNLANQAAVVWENARLYELATIDNLTRLYVRHYLNQRIQDELRNSKQSGKPFSLIMTDIDFFKKFNDTYGHQTGDEVLKLVAATMKQHIRQGVDLAARYGGEELTILAPETNSEDAFAIAERVRQAIQDASLPGPNGEELRVTISLGLATFPHHGTTEEDLYRRADEALYEAKRSGKNRVCIAT